MPICFLCDEESSRRMIDHENGYSVQCENPKCGHYEITIAVVDRIDSHNHLIPTMMEAARNAKAEGRYAEFLAGPNCSIIIK